MLITKAARRYATALLEIAKERDEVEDILEDIKLIHNTLEGSRELVLFLRSPIINYDDKAEVLNKLFGERVHEPTRLFLKLVARKGRVSLLDQIAEAYIDKYNQYAGIISVDIYAADELNDSQKEILHEALEAKTHKKVDMRITRDSDLKGGLAIRIDDTVIDGTVKHKLEELEQQLLTTAVE